MGHAGYLLKLLAMLAQARLLDYAGGPSAARVEPVLVQTPTPGPGDGGVRSWPMGYDQPLAEAENLMGMPSDLR